MDLLVRIDLKKSMTDYMMRKKIFVEEMINEEIKTISIPPVKFFVNGTMDAKNILQKSIEYSKTYSHLVQNAIDKRNSEDDGMFYFFCFMDKIFFLDENCDQKFPNLHTLLKYQVYQNFSWLIQNFRI